MSTDCLEEWFKRNDQLANDINSNKDELYKETMNVYKDNNGENNSEILWRLARSAYKAAAECELNGDKNTMRKLFHEAEDWAFKCVKINPQSPDGHSWCAFVCGKLSDIVSTKERIHKGKLVKTHLEEAIKYRPDESGLYYTYGRWSIEVAKLTWIEKKLAAALFDTLPDATYQDAIQQFVKADELTPNWKANLFYLGKAYIAVHNYKEAIKYFDKAHECIAKDEEDKTIENELNHLRNKYSSYREK